MKIGDLVLVKHGRWKGVLCVALIVTKKDIKNGINASNPGLYLFRGYWYGKDPLNHASYGKIEGKIGRVVGRMRNHQQAVMLKI